MKFAFDHQLFVFVRANEINFMINAISGDHLIGLDVISFFAKKMGNVLLERKSGGRSGDYRRAKKNGDYSRVSKKT